MFGTGEDKGVYYRCHYCGWPISIERNPEAFNDMGAKHGVTLTNVDEPDTVFPYENAKLLLESVMATFVLPEKDAAGDLKPGYYYYTRNISGCPFCGTRSNRT